MKNNLLLILGSLCIVSCTTIGQQITNHSGVLQIKQEELSSNARVASSTAATVATLDNLTVTRVSPDPFYTRSTIANNDYVVKTNNNCGKNTPIRQTNNNTNTIKTGSNQQNSTNNVSINVYTDSVNINNSSFLSDVYNYLFSE